MQKQPKTRAGWTQSPLQPPYSWGSSDWREERLQAIPTIAVWVGAGSVEALDTAGLAEGVLGTVGVEGVGSQIVSTLGREENNHSLSLMANLISHSLPLPLRLSSVQPFPVTPTRIPQRGQRFSSQRPGLPFGPPFRPLTTD